MSCPLYRYLLSFSSKLALITIFLTAFCPRQLYSGISIYMFAITRFRCIALLLHFTITRSGRSFCRRLRYIEVRLTVEVRRPAVYKFLTADIISYLRAIDVCKQPRRSSDGQESKTMARLPIADL